MPATVEKIRPDINATPETMLGMLRGHAGKIKHIAAVVVWEDESYQLVHDSMKKSDPAFALAIFQRQFFEDL
jgi:hypothetical protein